MARGDNEKPIYFVILVCGIMSPLVLCVLIIGQAFWLAAAIASNPNCTLVLYKGSLPCTYGSVLLELLTWILIVVVPHAFSASIFILILLVTCYMLTRKKKNESMLKN